MRTPEQIAADTIQQAYAHGDNVTPEEMLETVLDARDEQTPHDLLDLIVCAARAAWQEAYREGLSDGPAPREPRFKPADEPDEYRDAYELLAEPRCGAILRVGMPGDYFWGLSTDRARHILAYLSESEDAS